MDKLRVSVSVQVANKVLWGFDYIYESTRAITPSSIRIRIISLDQ